MISNKDNATWIEIPENQGLELTIQSGDVNSTTFAEDVTGLTEIWVTNTESSTYEKVTGTGSGFVFTYSPALSSACIKASQEGDFVGVANTVLKVTPPELAVDIAIDPSSIDPLDEGTSSLIAKYELETNGVATVGTISNANGTITYAPGLFGNSATSDGTATNNIPTSVQPWASLDRTISFWIKTSTTTSTEMCLGNVADAPNSYLQNNLNTNQGFHVYGTTNSVIGNTGFINDGQWHHVAIVYATADTKVYTDGDLISTGAANTTNTQELSLFSRGNTYGFNGSLDNIEVFDKALTSNEINSILSTGGNGLANTSTLDSVPVLTANDSSSEGLAFAATLGTDAWKAFSGTGDQYISAAGDNPEKIGFIYNSPRVINKINWTQQNNIYAPIALTIEGGNGTTDGLTDGTWTEIYSVTGLSWAIDETKTFTFPNMDAYEAFRINISSHSTGGDFMSCQHLEFIEAPFTSSDVIISNEPLEYGDELTIVKSDNTHVDFTVKGIQSTDYTTLHPLNLTSTNTASYFFENNGNDEGGTYNFEAIGTPTFGTGKFGESAWNCNNLNFYGETTSFALDMQTSSVSFWYYCTSTTAADAMLIYGYNLTNNERWYVTQNSLKVEFRNPDNLGVQQTSNDLVLNQWNHIVVSRDSATTISIYINNVVGLNGATVTAPISTAPTTFEVGRGGIGMMDHLRIFNGALSVSDVQKLYDESGFYKSDISSLGLLNNPKKIFKKEETNVSIVLDEDVTKASQFVDTPLNIVPSPLITNVSDTNPFADGSLVAKYEMNDNAATVDVVATVGTDASAQQNTSLMTGAGKFGTALTFNGTSDFVDIGALALNTVSFSLWIKADVWAGMPLQMGDDQGVENYVFLNGSNLDIKIGNATVSHPYTNTTNFFNVIGVKETTNKVSLYLDGAYIGESSTAATTIVQNTAFLGKRDSNTQYFAGAIDQVEIYNKALSVGEVQALYTQGQPELGCAADGSTFVTETPIADGDRLVLNGVDAALPGASVTEKPGTTNVLAYPDASCIAAYNLDSGTDGAGNTADLSGNYNGNASNITYTTGSGGKFGEAAIFNGTNSLIDIPNFTNPVADYSFTAWIKTTDTGVSNIICLDRWAGYLTINQDVAGKAFFRTYNGTTAYTTTSLETVNDGEWHFISVVHDSGALTIDLAVDNGTPTTLTYTGTPSILDGALPDTFGDNCNHDAASKYNGQMDQVRIFNKALNSTEIGELFNEQIPSFSADISASHALASEVKSAFLKGKKDLLSETPNDEFETVTYYGTGADKTVPLNYITGGVDFVWTKARTGAYNHMLSDSIRGISNSLASNNTAAETTAAGYDIIDFGVSSFTLGLNNASSNFAPNTYVGWCASLPNHIPVNNDGTIPSETKSNSFMSVVSYTGTGLDNATVAHGLETAPELLITKSRDTALTNWQTLQNVDPSYIEGDYMNFNLTTESTNSVNVSFLPTSTTWQMKAGQAPNVANDNFIAYAFTSVAGLCKVGSYTGTGAAGNHVSCGFKPAWIMIKQTNAPRDWAVFDNQRGGGSILYPDDPSAETTGSTYMSFDSDGFTLNNFGVINESGASYIYLAIAKNTPKSTNTSMEVNTDTAGLLKAQDTILVDGTENTVQTYTDGTYNTIDRNDEFETVIYDGNGVSRTIPTPNITQGVDFVWAKCRSTAVSSILYDSVRGATNGLWSDLTAAEETGDSAGLTAFNTDGFTIGGTKGEINFDTRTYVAWCVSLPNHTVSNTDGTITSETKSNDFMSAVSYSSSDNGSIGTAGTVGHGLNKAPELIIVKNRDYAIEWGIYSSSLAAGDVLFLGGISGNDAATTAATYFNSGTADNSVFPIGTSRATGWGDNYIAYAFTSVAGKCDIGSYAGNTTSGVTVDTGFEPQWLMVKNTAAGSWLIFDNKRELQAGNDSFIKADDSAAQDVTADTIEFYETGFKVTNNATTVLSADTNTYIYMCIAKNYTNTHNKATVTFNDNTVPASTLAIPDKGTFMTKTAPTFDGTKFNYTFTPPAGFELLTGRAIGRKIHTSKAGTTITGPFTTSVSKEV